MSKKQQERKKKKRQEIAKKRVLARRKALRSQLSENKKTSRLDKKFREKISPIVKDLDKKKDMEDKKNEKILSKLEKNAEILKALEDEYLEEMNRKKIINEKLESEGHYTLKDKLNALDKHAQDFMTEQENVEGKIDLTSENNVIDAIGEKVEENLS